MNVSYNTKHLPYKCHGLCTTCEYINGGKHMYIHAYIQSVSKDPAKGEKLFTYIVL